MLAGTADVAAHRSGPAAPLPVAPPVRGSGAHDGAALRDVAVPRRRIRGGPLPPRAVRRRARRHSACRPDVHWYDPHDHALVRIGPPPRGGAPTLVVTGVPWRTGWRYRERGYRHVYWDAGTMLAQLLAVADSAGLTALLHTRFPDAAVAALVGCGRRARVARCRRRPRRGRARTRRDGFRGQRRRRRGTRGVPARHGGAAGWGARRDRVAVGPRRPGRGARRGSRPGRGRRARARVAAPHGPDPRAAGRACCARPCARRCAASRCRTASWCTTSKGSRPVSIAGRTCRTPGTPRRDARRALPGVPRAGARSRRGVRRDRGEPTSARSTTGSTARRSSLPAWSRAGCTCSPTASARAPPG